jgi:hypothetical protein
MKATLPGMRDAQGAAHAATRLGIGYCLFYGKIIVDDIDSIQRLPSC